MPQPIWKEDIEEEVLVEENIEETHQIILHNDDYNTFDHVIDSLIQICGHSEPQAEQCAMIVHYNGKCQVKKGSKKELIPRHRKLLDKGLSSEIV